MALATARNPIRTKARRLLRRFLDHIEREMGDEADNPDAIPEITNGQWRTVSAVLATYRMMVDEHQAEQELELARLDYSKLSIEELHILVARFRGHPQLAGTNGGEEEVIDVSGSNGN